MAEPSQRHADAQRRLELAAAAANAEAAAAQPQLDAFVAQARARGLAPEPLQATLLSGRRVKTPLSGWYLNAARTIAVGTGAEFYNLVTSGSALARFTGVTPQPARPVLEIGRGGRDGETGPLADFLARALENYAAR
ncbi:MAG: hypothetical protein LCH76_08690 [Actinobacteria bacterium]|nr:hypothetical protein [Actinomycetota bacterium]